MKIEIEEIKKMIGKRVIIKNGPVMVGLVIKDIVDAKEASYDVKQNAREGLLCVINGDALAINNTYSDDEHLNELISSSSSKKISVLGYEKTTEISLFPYKKEKIETLCDSFWMT